MAATLRLDLSAGLTLGDLAYFVETAAKRGLPGSTPVTAGKGHLGVTITARKVIVPPVKATDNAKPMRRRRKASSN